MGISFRKVSERHCQQANGGRSNQPRRMQNDKIRFPEFRSHEMKRPPRDSSKPYGMKEHHYTRAHHKERYEISEFHGFFFHAPQQGRDSVPCLRLCAASLSP